MQGWSAISTRRPRGEGGAMCRPAPLVFLGLEESANLEDRDARHVIRPNLRFRTGINLTAELHYLRLPGWNERPSGEGHRLHDSDLVVCTDVRGTFDIGADSQLTYNPGVTISKIPGRT